MSPVPVVAYFAGDPSRTYQLIQWLEVLEALREVHPVCLILRDRTSTTLIESRTDLPVFTAETLAELAELYAELEPRVVELVTLRDELLADLARPDETATAG